MAALLGMMALDERFTGRQLVAGLAVLASVALVIAVQRPQQVEGLPAGTPVAPT
ncbi:hypothetical protein [Micromonospora sp. NPDC005299]|uniref:hypothetical protein n=1 Tax=Micromonospora sp. NPDC005299 TaxID=3364231 RepID=UPI003689C055